MSGRNIASAIDPKQGILCQGDIEFQVQWMMDRDLEPPKEARWDRLHHLISNFNFSRVYCLSFLKYYISKKQKDKKKSYEENMLSIEKA